MRKLTQTEVRLLVVVTSLTFLAISVYISSNLKIASIHSENDKQEKNEEALMTFSATDDTAKAVYVFDATTKKVLYERNANEALPLASVTKLVTALTAKKYVGAKYTLSISQQALEANGDSDLSLSEKWDVDSLIGFMLVSSSNDAARQIKYSFDEQGGDFIQAMNDYAKSLGLTGMVFNDPAGLDSSNAPGGIGSARDVSVLILDFLEKMPEIANLTTLPQATFKSLSGRNHTVSNTNDLSTQIDTLLASKTGYTSLAGGNLAVVYRVPVFDHTIVIVILGSTKDGRFVDIKSYMEGVENYFKISQK
jgi:D-alanyl-D-alanine carboxypeptidase